MAQMAAALPLDPRMNSVSVVVPTRGTKPERLLAAVRSAVAQTFAPAEVLVVVDGAECGGVASLLAPYGSVRVLALGRASGGRPGVVRNRGVAAASGNWIAFLDDDDAWAPTKLDAQLRAVALDGTRFCCAATAPASPAPPGRTFGGGHIAAANRIACSTVLVARSSLVAAGGFGEERYGQDWRCWQRCLADGSPATYLAEPLARLNDDAADLDRSTVRADTRRALRQALGSAPPGAADPAALVARFSGF